MKLDEKDILFLKTYLENADELIASADTYNLLDALDELSVATMDENDEITDIGRKSERLIDKIVYGEQHAQAVCFFISERSLIDVSDLIQCFIPPPLHCGSVLRNTDPVDI